MDIRYSASLILIAIGAMVAFLGVIGLVNPAGGLAPGLRLGCGGLGAVGVLFVLLGLRLRNRAVAESPELQKALQERGETSRTEVAKPGFLKGQLPTKAASTPPPREPQPPVEPSRVALIYWLIVLAFSATLIGLTFFAVDFFQTADALRLGFLVVALLLLLLMPATWGRKRRGGAGRTRLGRSSSDGNAPADSSKTGGGAASGGD